MLIFALPGRLYRTLDAVERLRKEGHDVMLVNKTTCVLRPSQLHSLTTDAF